MMRGHVGPGCTARLLATAPCTGLYNGAVGSSVVEQGFIYSTSSININVPISMALWRKVCLPAHGFLGKPGHYPIPEAGT